MNKNIMIKLLLCLLLLAARGVEAQTPWVKDYKVAQALAISQNKLIVMDFWAIWCGPCRTMDSKMWSTEEMRELSNNFILLKIDVDQNKSLALKYRATSIPKVIIIDPIGNTVWDKVGFSSATPYLKVLESLSLSNFNKTDLINEINGESTPNNWYSLGLSYQQMGVSTFNPQLKMGMLTMSNKYFKKVIKQDKDNEKIEEITLQIILNHAYRGNVNKALKQLSKIDYDGELKNFVLAYCYKCKDNQIEMEKYKAMLNDPHLLKQLY